MDTLPWPLGMIWGRMWLAPASAAPQQDKVREEAQLLLVTSTRSLFSLWFPMHKCPKGVTSLRTPKPCTLETFMPRNLLLTKAAHGAPRAQAQAPTLSEPPAFPEQFRITGLSRWGFPLAADGKELARGFLCLL